MSFGATGTRVATTVRKVCSSAPVVILAGLAALSSTGASASPLRFAETLMTGLANPRGLTIGADGSVYVAEAGSGGSGPTIISGDGFTVLGYGTTGAVSRLIGGVQQKVVTGLPSFAPAGGAEAHGPQDLAFGADGRLYLTAGLGGDPRQLDASDFDPLPESDLAGTLAVIDGGVPLVFADVPQFEIDNNPDGGNIDTNVYGIVPDGSGFLVTDAGGNSVLSVDASGAISTVGVLPDLPTPAGSPVPAYQAVPTGAIAGRGGKFVFGQLTGFPFVPKAARIYRLSRGILDEIGSGFTNVIDVGLGTNGKIHVLELDSDSLLGAGTTGAIYSIAHDGTKNLLFDNLERPTGFVIDADGNFLVSVDGLSPTDGKVVRLAPVPVPAALPALAGGLGLLGLLGFRRRGEAGA